MRASGAGWRDARMTLERQLDRVNSSLPGCALFLQVWVPFARGNQASQAAVDIEAPRVRALIEALILRNQSLVSEAELGFVALLRHLEDDFRAVPLALVCGKAQPGVQDQPDDLSAGNDLH